MTKKDIPRIMIAAASSGSGKTMITCGLLSWMKNSGKNINSYKCGPDYIDPMFHERVIGIPASNLDTFFSAHEDIRRIIARSECSVIEGVMGIYDGLGGIKIEASSYDVAKASGTPIILVVDGHGCGRTLISLIKGVVLDDTDELIRGIIINRIPGSFYETLLPELISMLKSIDRDIKLLGFLPKLNGVSIDSRHLGLKMPWEIGNIQEQIIMIEDALKQSVNLNLLEKIMNEAEPVIVEDSVCELSASGLRLAVAMDNAFCFYYEENLNAFKRYGIELVPFSPLTDENMPDNIHGLWLGGGYPELYLKELSNNKSMLSSIREAIQAGLPSLAECGGFMYLHDSILDEEGNSYPMAGVIKGSCEKKSRLVRFGYIELSGKNNFHKPVTEIEVFRGIRGHEFHYYDSTNNGTSIQACKPNSGRTWECMHIGKNHAWGFPHLYYGSKPEIVDWFTGAMREYYLHQ